MIEVLFIAIALILARLGYIYGYARGYETGFKEAPATIEFRQKRIQAHVEEFARALAERKKQ